MAFWRVAGFAQPSPIEQILDKEEYTLEELLDEDDIIQECKSLNGRLIAFLRSKDVVEQLLRYLVQPPSDPDDPKKQYKYPFTACEVFCCEVEAVFNTLLEDEALLGLLFSLLDTEPPLSCKTAGYFGRVVGQLLLRKPNEMMQYLSNNDELLEKLVRHLDVTSIADVIKRLAGADEQSAMVFMPMHTQWLVETRLLDMLLERLGPEWSGDTVTNAADILTAIAHTQPSALSAKLMQPASIAALFRRALEPGGKALVPALEVCSALLEPRRVLGGDAYGPGSLDGGGGGSNGGASGSGGGASPTAAAAAAARPRVEALSAMLVYLPQLVSFLATPADATATQETPYGLLAPPLGRARLKVVELLAVLLHVGDEAVDGALIASNAMRLAMDLFAQYPFNNLLHHQVFYMLRGLLVRATPAMLTHTLGTCRLVSWLSSLPVMVDPTPRPGAPPPKGPLRAGYLGHVTRMANLLVEAAASKQAVADALASDESWQRFAVGELQRRNEVEDVSQWECGRPASTDMGEMGSDVDEFQADMDMEQMQGMQPALYHRYGVLDDIDDDEDEGGAGGGGAGAGADYSGGAYSTMLADAMQNMDLSDGPGTGVAGADESMVLGEVREREVQAASGGEAGVQGAGGGWSLLAHPGAPSPPSADITGERSMEDDAVLLTTSDDEDGTGPSASSPGPGELPPGSLPVPAKPAGAEQMEMAASPGDDMVMVEPPGEDAGAAAAAAAAGSAAATASAADPAPSAGDEAASDAQPMAAEAAAPSEGSSGAESSGGSGSVPPAAKPATATASAQDADAATGSDPSCTDQPQWGRPLPVQVPEQA